MKTRTFFLNERLGLWNADTVIRTLALASLLLMLSASASAGVRTRAYSFEEGTAGGTITSAEDSIVGPFVDVPDFNLGDLDFYDLGHPGGNLSIPNGSPLNDYLTANHDPTPALEDSTGTVTYVDVSDGTALDSPVPGSTLAASFTGNDAIETNSFIGNFIQVDAIAANAPAADNTNVFRSFTNFTQAWVRPDSSAMGSDQSVWAMGTETGGVGITADGFWELNNLGPPSDVISSVGVVFDAWTHLAVVRTGGGATLYVNGSVGATAPQGGDPGFFNTFGDFLTVGTDAFLLEGFTGLIDSFGVGGTGGLGITIATDLDFFADTGVSPPSGVLGDVDQDGDVDQADYDIWSANAGFDNGFGQGDLITLNQGDVDGNGKIDFFDFNFIAQGAAAAGVALRLGGEVVPEPTSAVLLLAGGLLLLQRRAIRVTSTLPLCAIFIISIALAGAAGSVQAEVVVAEDFFYDQPTKGTADLNGFAGRSYGGGQNGAGFWDDRWEAVGGSTIVGTDVVNPPLSDNPHTALVTGFASTEQLIREYQLAESNQMPSTLYFAADFKVDDPSLTTTFAEFSILNSDGDSAVSLGIAFDLGSFSTTFFAEAGANRVVGDPDTQVNDAVVGGTVHRVVGKVDLTYGVTAGDYNGNGAIDGGDFLVWQREVGAGAGSPADGNADGAVDGGDLAIWQQVLNQAPGATGATLSVYFDPTGEEASNATVLTVSDTFTFSADTVVELNGLPGANQDPIFVDNIAIGTTWDDVAVVAVPRLSLEVNTDTGETKIVNNSSEDLELAFYEILSDSGSLDAASWNSLSDQGTSPGVWAENNPDASQLIESNLTGAATVLAAGGELGLGNAFSIGGTEDLVARFGVVEGNDGLLNLMEVSYTTSPAVTGVPEPSAAILAMFAIGIFGLRNRSY